MKKILIICLLLLSHYMSAQLYEAFFDDKKVEKSTEIIDRGDIVITEIMAKPNPSVELPEVEWVEIYNTTDRAIALEGCKISTPSKTGTFKDYTLEAQEYVVICSQSAMTELTAITDKICVVGSMPALNNDGNILIIKDKNDQIISFVEYTSDWYKSEPFKADGGWSLERRDATNPLSNSTTWIPSIDPRGGTPAERNSTACSLPDDLTPRIIGLGINDSRSVQIDFNKPMQIDIVDLHENIEISGNAIKSLDWVEPQQETLNLHLAEALDSINAIDISFYNFSCISGWSMPDTTISLALPRQAQYMDVIFNELMPYISDGNSKFIELYNNSDFYIDLSRLMLSNRNENGDLKNSKLFCNSSKIIPPRQYAVISPDTSAINCPLGINQESIYITSALPSMAASGGTLVLSDRGGIVIDEVHYSDSWHHPLLTDLHDISLERIDPMGLTQEARNWHSSASHNTAGWINSQTINTNNSQSDKYFLVKNTTFSPDNDGDCDYLIINHNLPEAGYTLTIDAYTRHGVHVSRIIDNQLISPQGYTIWNGTTKDNSIVQAGLYVLVVQAIHTNGDKITRKFICIKK